MNREQADALYWVLDMAIDIFRDRADGLLQGDAREEERDLLLLLDLLDSHGRNTVAMRAHMPTVQFDGVDSRLTRKDSSDADR